MKTVKNLFIQMVKGLQKSTQFITKFIAMASFIGI